MAFSDEEIERYARHLVLKEFGGAGQQALKNASVLIVGAGGLGAPVALYLAAAGVGTLHIVDDDEVSLSNLQRQVIHDSDQIGQAKIESASKALARVNPHVKVVGHKLRFDEANATNLLKGIDLVLDGSDNFDTRYLVAEKCEIKKISLVSGAVGRFDGNVSVFEPWKCDVEGNPLPRYKDLFPNPPPQGSVPSCAEAGVLGAITGIIGSLMAMEAIKVLAKFGEPLLGRLLIYDGLEARSTIINYKRH